MINHSHCSLVTPTLYLPFLIRGEYTTYNITYCRGKQSPCVSILKCCICLLEKRYGNKWDKNIFYFTNEDVALVMDEKGLERRNSSIVYIRVFFVLS